MLCNICKKPMYYERDNRIYVEDCEHQVSQQSFDHVDNYQTYIFSYQIWYNILYRVELFLHHNTLSVWSRIIWCVFFLARWLSVLTTACPLITWSWLCSWWRHAIRCMHRWRRAWAQRSLTLTCSPTTDGTSMWRYIKLYSHHSFLTINSLGGWSRDLKLQMQVFGMDPSFIFSPLSRNKMVISPPNSVQAFIFIFSNICSGFLRLALMRMTFKKVGALLHKIFFSLSICVCSLQTDTTCWDLRPLRVCSTCTNSPTTANTGTGVGTYCKISTSTPEWVRNAK